MPGAGSLWHLPHLGLQGHLLHCVAGSPAGKQPGLPPSSTMIYNSLVYLHTGYPSEMSVCPEGGVLQWNLSPAGAGALWT